MRDSDQGNRFGGRRDGGRPTMYHAVCAECGKDCEVPFQPSGDKPVYCSTCFGNKGGNENRRSDRDSGRRDFGRPDFRDREKRSFSAICDKCGKQCEVPFRPTEGKPVFCDQCFTRPAAGGAKSAGPSNADQLTAINAKLDNILKALGVASSTSAPKKQAETKKPIAKKAAPKKKISKKK